jgi:hypothetical protein
LQTTAIVHDYLPADCTCSPRHVGPSETFVAGHQKPVAWWNHLPLGSSRRQACSHARYILSSGQDMDMNTMSGEMSLVSQPVPLQSIGAV